MTGPGARELDVVADFAAGSSDTLETDRDSSAYVRRIEVSIGGRWQAALRRGNGWTAPCRTAGCRIRYAFARAEAAAETDDVDTAIATGGVVIAPPSTWLVRPAEPTTNGRFRFHVRTDGAVQFDSGVLPVAVNVRDTYEASTSEIDATSFCAFGSFRRRAVHRDGAEIILAIAPTGLRIDADAAAAWIDRAVAGIAAYYGRFPVRRALVIVVPGARENVEGLTLGDGGPAVVLRVGPGLNADTVRDDWVATHELLHVTLPSLSRNHLWLSEGIATYVEPIARARAGIVNRERFWSDLVKGLPQGLPQAGDEGLERTHTWGRTYWGGALFCLVADVQIRKATDDTRSFDDALRGVVATGADVQSHWEIDRFLAVGDAATGTHVLADLYRELALAPGSVNLANMWSELGVRIQGDSVTFDDNAPLASVRRSITDASSKQLTPP